MTTPEVDQWLARYDNPKRDVVARVRRIVLDADERITETIKWNTPTFSYLGDMASFYPLSLEYATLVFHQGQRLPGRYPHMVKEGDRAGVVRVTSFVEAEDLRDEIEQLVAAWIRLRDDAAARTPGGAD